MEPIPAPRIARLRKQRAFLPLPSTSKVRTSHLICRREATMRRSTLATALVAVFISYLATPAAVKAGGYKPTDLVTNRSFTDKNGIPHTGQIQDANMLKPWGVTEIPTGMGSPFWVADNAAGVATLYNVPHDAPNTVTKNPRVVSIPTPVDLLGSSGAPTGAVFNITLNSNKQEFMISGVKADGMTKITAPARFLFATEDGTIVGWNPDVNPEDFKRNAG